MPIKWQLEPNPEFEKLGRFYCEGPGNDVDCGSYSCAMSAVRAGASFSRSSGNLGTLTQTGCSNGFCANLKRLGIVCYDTKFTVIT